MGLQSQWIKEVMTKSKMNNMTIIGENGTVLAGLTGKFKGQVVVSYDTSGGFVQWHLYVWDGTSAWIEATLPVHKHTGNADGGPFVDLFINNNQFLEYNEPMSHIADWVTSNTGTGSAVNVHDNGTDIARRYQTGTSSTGFGTGTKGGAVYMNYSQRILFNWVWQISAITNVFFSFGLDMENINVAQNNNNKIGVEWCDGQANANYYVTTASGSARSSSDSTVALTTTIDGVKMLFTPGGQASFVFDAGPTTINKSTNLPSGAGLGNNALREGAKNNNGGVANRDLRILGMRVYHERNLGQWVIA
ncbi:MAG TPA: hypothetical protein VL854_06645 [Nitrososphaeraceae archaeon]|nr:hypothetical protein [Nitrososphaeraceae archaeon]